MADDLNELLSAFMDGEADDLQRRRIANALLEDPDMLARWRRYHAQRALLRADGVVMAGDGGAARLRQALESEPAYGPAEQAPAGAAAAARATRRPWLSLAAAAGLGLTVGAGLTGGWLSPLAQRQPAAVVANPAAALQPDVALTADDEHRARLYMLLHAQQAGGNLLNGPTPLMKFVSYQTP